jgi:hypothetical protein
LRWTCHLAITLIGCDRLLVSHDRFLPATAPDIDVRRHMNVVRQSRLQLAQPIGRLGRALRMRRSLDRVDVEMVGEGMVRIQLQDRLEGSEHLFRAGIRLAFRRPLVPWAQIHRRLGKQDTYFRILRITLPNLAHRIGVSLVERCAIFRLRIGIALTECLDQVLLDLACLGRVLFRQAQFLPGQICRRSRHNREVDVGPAGQGDPQ